MTQSLGQVPRLVFLHLPKTGGTSFEEILDRQYGPEAERLHVAGDIANIRAFLKNRADDLAGIRALAGHMPWGIADRLPGASAYVTFLRHPYERVISDYYYIRGAPHHHLNKSLVGGDVDFAQFVQKGHSFNSMCRRLFPYDIDGSEVFDAQEDEDILLNTAIDNLESCAVVGLCEQFSESVARVADLFKWKTVPNIPRSNKASGRPGFADLPARHQALIVKNNHLDLALYQHGCRLFERQKPRTDPA